MQKASCIGLGNATLSITNDRTHFSNNYSWQVATKYGAPPSFKQRIFNSDASHFIEKTYIYAKKCVCIFMRSSTVHQNLESNSYRIILKKWDIFFFLSSIIYKKTQFLLDFEIFIFKCFINSQMRFLICDKWIL